jgi:hypothetical protein
VYNTTGNFNGSISVSDKYGSDCKQVRYFSASVSEDDRNEYFGSFLLLILISVGLLSLNYIATKDKQNSVQK